MHWMTKNDVGNFKVKGAKYLCFGLTNATLYDEIFSIYVLFWQVHGLTTVKIMDLKNTVKRYPYIDNIRYTYICHSCPQLPIFILFNSMINCMTNCMTLYTTSPNYPYTCVQYLCPQVLNVTQCLLGPPISSCRPFADIQGRWQQRQLSTKYPQNDLAYYKVKGTPIYVLLVSLSPRLFFALPCNPCVSGLHDI